MTRQASDDASSSISMEELECKICYRLYNLGARRPKVLGCLHRLCGKCLSNMAGLVEVPEESITCPFCRHPTYLTGESASGLPDDHNIVKALALRGRKKRSANSSELLLCPGGLSSTTGALSSSVTASNASPPTLQRTSSCMVITIMEATHEPLDLHSQAGDAGSHLHSRVLWMLQRIFARSGWYLAQFLVGLLLLLYFGSLPLGIYLLAIKKTSVGIFLVCLVPAAMLMIIVYDIFQCFCPY